MIEAYVLNENRLIAAPDAGAALMQAVWIDMQSPTEAEERLVEAALEFDIPTKGEMQEIESTSRIYAVDGAQFLTASIVSLHDGETPVLAPVTFILSGGRLVTVRYHQPRSIRTFSERAAAGDMGCRDAPGVLLALLETLVDRLADLLEGVGSTLDGLSAQLFRRDKSGTRARDRLSVLLDRIGQAEDLNAKLQESLSTLDRVVAVLNQKIGSAAADRGEKARTKAMLRDIHSLMDYAATHGHKIGFLLDATLGFINMQQSDIIKIFSVVAFVFLPPTLIASIYGMNFVHLPELKWWFGYPMALGMMVVSAVLPYLYFRRKGWL
ncbi:MAG: magnesium transporter CorA family protein [Paracoccaceae bacterium]